jgi:hypothetical protein
MQMDEIMVKLLILSEDQILISEIEDVGSEMGEPDCKLINPFIVNGDNLEPWLVSLTNQNIFMIHSDKILTLIDPKPTLLEKYQQLTK